MILQGPGWCTASSRAWCAAARRQLVFLGVLLCDCIYIYMIMLLCYMILHVCFLPYIHTYTGVICNSVFFLVSKELTGKNRLSWSSCGSLQGMMMVRRWSCDSKNRNTRSQVRVDLIKPRKTEILLAFVVFPWDEIDPSSSVQWVWVLLGMLNLFLEVTLLGRPQMSYRVL